VARITNVISEMVQWWPGKADQVTPGTTQVPAGPSRQLELLLPFRWPDSNLPIRWCIRLATTVENQGTVTSLDELSPELVNLPLLVYIDPLDTAIVQENLPPMSRKNYARALPFALEDRLLGDVGQQFFAPMRNDSDGTSVCVIAHARIKAILSALTTLHFHPYALMPAISSTPMLENTWTLVVNDQFGWVRTGEACGMAVKTESLLPPYVLKKSLQGARDSGSAPTALLLVNAPAELDAKVWSTELQLEVIQPEGGLWENTGHPSSNFNLLQGPYKQKSAARVSSNRFRLAIALILVLAAGNIGAFSVDWFRMYRESRTVNSEMVMLFKTSFPDQASTVIDPVLQMQSNLDRLRRDKGGASVNDFLSLLLPVSKSLSGNPVSDSAVSRVRYADQSIIVDVHLANYQNLDRLKKAFTENRLTVQVLQAESGSGGVQAKLKLVLSRENES